KTAGQDSMRTGSEGVRGSSPLSSTSQRTHSFQPSRLVGGVSVFPVRSSVIGLRRDLVLLVGQNWSTAPAPERRPCGVPAVPRLNRQVTPTVAKRGTTGAPAHRRPHSVTALAVVAPPRVSAARGRRAAATGSPERRGNRSR